CSTPCADVSPASVARRTRSLPSTDTYTVASLKSGVTVTPVTVTSPMRGSFRSRTPSATTARTDSFTRRIRSGIASVLVARRHEQAVAAHERRLARREPALGPGRELVGLARAARRAGDGQRRALPQVMVVDL